MSSMSHETAIFIMGLFYNFTFVKMKGPNKYVLKLKLKALGPRINAPTNLGFIKFYNFWLERVFPKL